MSYKIQITKTYKKRLLVFLKKHLTLKKRYYKVIELLENDPFHPSLRLHKLQGKHQDLHSVSINMQYRITLELEITGKEILLINIGDHSDVYS